MPQCTASNPRTMAHRAALPLAYRPSLHEQHRLQEVSPRSSRKRTQEQRSRRGRPPQRSRSRRRIKAVQSVKRSRSRPSTTSRLKLMAKARSPRARGGRHLDPAQVLRTPPKPSAQALRTPPMLSAHRRPMPPIESARPSPTPSPTPSHTAPLAHSTHSMILKPELADPLQRQRWQQG